jgi:hypothetical protein
MPRSLSMAVAAALAVALVAAAVAPAGAEPASGDGYCDYVEGVASAESALLFAPELFASYGYLDQPAEVDVPDSRGDDLRITAGVRYRLSGIYQGLLTRGRASADCRRHRALGQVQGETIHRALAARARVLDEALGEAQKMLDEAAADLEQRRASAQDVTATRLRVDELRALAAATRRELAALPAPAAGPPLATALTAYHAADAEVERHEGRLRRAQAFDLTVRFGYDRFLENDEDDSPYFALVSVGVNLGWLLQGSGNQRAAAGRRRMVRDGGGAGRFDATVVGLRSALERDRQRQQETGVLVADLERQLAQLRGIGGDSGRRYRQTVWFEWVKLRAEHAYLTARVDSLEGVLGGEAP